VLQLGYDCNTKDLKLHNTTQGYTYVNLLVNLQGDVMLVQRALILLQQHTVCLQLLSKLSLFIRIIWHTLFTKLQDLLNV